jgi:lactoylglutathione lyase
VAPVPAGAHAWGMSPEPNQPNPPDHSPAARPRLVGINHVALEVGAIEAALAFYGSVFGLGEVVHEGPGMAFVDMGDQFLALIAGRSAPPDAERHFGLVVDDREAVRRRVEELGIEVVPGGRLDIRDPWGNRLQIVDYRDIRFTKAPSVLAGMGLDGLAKRPGALRELAAGGLV